MRTYRTVRYPLGEGLPALYRWRGPLINAGVGGHATYLPGAEANRFVRSPCRRVQLSQTFESLVPADGPTALIVMTARGLPAPLQCGGNSGLRHHHVQRYVATMVSNIDTVITVGSPTAAGHLPRVALSAVRRSTARRVCSRPAPRRTFRFSR